MKFVICDYIFSVFAVKIFDIIRVNEYISLNNEMGAHMKELAHVFKALSDTNRIRILKMLETRSLCVCEITELLGLAASTVSKHLSMLRDAEFIRDDKDGKWVNYHLNIEQTNEYIRHLLPLIRTWLPEDEVIMKDKEKLNTIDRNILCNI